MLAAHSIVSFLVIALVFTDYCYCHGQDADCSHTLKVVNSTTGTISSDEVNAMEVHDDLKCYWSLNSTLTNYLVKINVTNGGDHIKFRERKLYGCKIRKFWKLSSWWGSECSKQEKDCRDCFEGDGENLQSGKIFCYTTKNCNKLNEVNCELVKYRKNTRALIEFTLKETFSFTYHFTDCSPKTTSQPMSSVSTITSTAIMLNTTHQTTPDKETISSSEQVAANSSEPDTSNGKKNSSSRPMQDTSGENTLVIASCSVGAVLLLIFIVILIIVIYRKRKKQGGKGMSGGRSEPAVSDQREIVNNEIYNMDIAPNNEREMVDNVLYGSADPAQNQKVDNALYATAENI